MSRNSKKSPQIHFMGGLGNQLFQFAFAHEVFSKKKERLNFSTFKNLVEDRPFELQSLLQNCSHIDSEGKIIRRFPLMRSLALRIMKFSFWRKKFHQNFPIIFGTELNPFTDRKKIHLSSKVRTHIGYFQNWNLVEKTFDLFRYELDKALENISLIDLDQIDFKNVVVIHIRRGDYLNPSNSFGILTPEYYLKALELIPGYENKSKIIVTDDPIHIKDIESKLNPNLILGPDQLSAWQTLKLISMSKYFILANSTLSWWGAYLAKSYDSNAVCIVPSPWFRDLNMGVEAAFEHPSFVCCESDFLKN